MDVSYSNNITDLSKALREKVYNTDEFKKEFATELEQSIGAVETSFVPDQFGGWSVNICLDRDKSDVEDHTSSSYIGKISEALASSIHDLDHSAKYTSDVASNLINVMITGPSSIVVKL